MFSRQIKFILISPIFNDLRVPGGMVPMFPHLPLSFHQNLANFIKNVHFSLEKWLVPHLGLFFQNAVSLPKLPGVLLHNNHQKSIPGRIAVGSRGIVECRQTCKIISRQDWIVWMSAAENKWQLKAKPIGS